MVPVLQATAALGGVEAVPARRQVLPCGAGQARPPIVEQAGGEVVGVRFAVELSSEFDARKTLEGYDVESVLKF